MVAIAIREVIPMPTVVPMVTPVVAAPSATPKEFEKADSKKVKTKKIKLKKTKKKLYAYSSGYIKVRSITSKKSNFKFLLKPAQRVSVKKMSKNWLKVTTRDNKTGYVMKKFFVDNKKKARRLSNQKTEEFRLTGYWGDSTTKSGRRLRLQHTIAADLSVLPMYTEVYIRGMGAYRVEDVVGFPR